MDIGAELRFEYCPHCGESVKRIRSHRKKCKKCGTVYFFRNSSARDGKLKVEEADRSEYKEKVEKKAVAAKLRGAPGEIEKGRRSSCLSLFKRDPKERI